MVAKRRCIDCETEGVGPNRPAPHPGPRCATHHRLKKRERSAGAWERRMIATYGITAEEYWRIYEAQGGRCYICRRATGARKRLSVDHDHKTGQVRGLLETTCNKTILGHSRDDPDFFRRCIEYLEHPPAIDVIGERVVPGHPDKPIEGTTT